jgi:hypothetical protein
MGRISLKEFGLSLMKTRFESVHYMKRVALCQEGKKIG